ncbi:hypothetical protein [Croceicoccus naphthovorans]|uniref:hypothetical protein n=1 Tax=Croceicoccus naphthovorans TaxID=1348774 RepID=UPI0017F85CE5|nr:hypothetical protein [Croceicoccus naphthovorans]MBB3989820.1 hypothetical protein [Croceicoccus naphthovorans]
MRTTGTVLTTAAAIGLAATPAIAKKAASLQDLNGARAAGAESELQSRGWKYVDGHKGGYGAAYSNWWHHDSRNCVQVEVMDGHVMTINDVTAQDCGHSEHGSGAGTAVAAVAGAALLAALVSHKSHHHDDNKHDDDAEAEALYERGYTDGLHNVAYHNSGRSDAYSSGYSAGVDQRTANTGHHHGSGGYRAKAEFKDLTGARAAGADSTLTSRGFANVDGFKSGSTAYTIWSRPQSNQCLQMTVADGHVYDISDIGHHPKC